MTFTKQIAPATQIDEFRNRPAKIDYGYVGVAKDGQTMVTVMTSDGFEDIVSCRFAVGSEAEGSAYLVANGFTPKG